MDDREHEVSRTGSLHPTVDWLKAHGQRVAGPFGSMAATPAVFWTPADEPSAAPRMAVPGDTLAYGDGEVRVMLPPTKARVARLFDVPEHFLEEPRP
jgi:hypothetical protein